MLKSNILLSSEQDISTDAELFYRNYWQPADTDAPVQQQVALRKEFVIHTLMSQPVAGSRVLELGVGGEGGIIFALLSSADIHGVDVSDSAIERCRHLGIPVRKVNCDTTPLPYDDDYFDTVIALEVFEHFANPQFVLEEIRRVLKPRGTLVVSTPSPYTYHWPRLFYPDLFAPAGFYDFLLANRFRPIIHTDPFCRNCCHGLPLLSPAETSFSLYWQASKISDEDISSLHAAGLELFNRRDQHGRRTRPIEALELLKRCIQLDASSLVLQTDYLCALLYRFINGDSREFCDKINAMLDCIAKGENREALIPAILTIHREAEALKHSFLTSDIVDILASQLRTP